MPNITGSFNAAANDHTPKGAFKMTKSGVGGVASGGYVVKVIDFDAKFSSSLYGGSCLVQAQSLRLTSMIRI